MTRKWHAIIAAFALGGAALIHLKERSDLEHARAAFRHEAHDDAIRAAARVEAHFRAVFEGLRTIARLPGVRSIDPRGRNFDANARGTAQEIYNNLASGHAISEFYIVPLALDPDAAAGSAAPRAPIATFDELIVGRTAGAEHRGQDGPVVEEVEIDEYRLMRRQLAQMRALHPEERRIDGLRYPAYGGPEVITCDNSRYDPRRPDDRDRSGLVYSVPFFGPGGALEGAISGVMLTHALRDLLPAGPYVLHQAANGWLAASHAAGDWRRHREAIHADRPAPGLIYSEALPLAIDDASGRWTLWVGLPDASFWQRGDVLAARHAAWLGYALVALLAIAMLLVQRSVAQRRLMILEMNRELSDRVRERTRDLELERDRAHAATRAKSEFLANMSHEIRTPMNGVLGMLELLSMTKLDREQRDFTEIARGSADALLVLINDILDFSKIEAGKLDLEEIPFDLHRAIEEPCRLLAARAQEKGIELTCFVPPEVPRSARGDPTRLRQLLMNLVGNAIKFTERGEVSVWASATSGPAGALQLAVEVRDTGIGIPAEARSRLFQAFSQADGSTTRRYGGTGLGLAICARIVQMMEGQIEVQSEPGHGSTFRFTVMLRESQEPQSRSDGALSLSERLGALRALVVDDNATNRLILERHLAAWGIAHDSVADVDAALAALHAAQQSGKPFRLALVDYHMQGRDGLELGREMQRDPALREVARIMLSSHGGVARSELDTAGFAACHAKPVRASQLFDDIAGLFGLPLETRTAEPAGPPAGAVAATGPAAAPRVLLVEDNTVNQKVAIAALARLGIDAALVTDGQQACDRLAGERYDLVLMDCQMPVLDGFAATREIRAREAREGRAHQLIVAMTANTMQGDEQRCREAGMDDFLTKPFNLAALAALLERCLPGFTATPPAAAADAKLARAGGVQKRNV
ncbi:MAG: response regulator [Steroidobacteraceae bacterium]